MVSPSVSSVAARKMSDVSFGTCQPYSLAEDAKKPIKQTNCYQGYLFEFERSNTNGIELTSFVRFIMTNV